MKTIPIALAEHYQQPTTTLATLWRVVRTDGEIFAFTDHDAPITFDGLTYTTTSSFDPSAVSTKSDMQVDNLEVVGVLSAEGITAQDIEAGRWDGAAIEIRRVNWADLTMGAEIVRVGELGNVRRQSGQYVAEMRGLMAHLQNNIQRIFTPSCNAQLGDARCKVDLTPFQHAGAIGTIQGDDNRTFTSSGMPSEVAYFAGGTVLFTSGANDGIAMEVKAFVGGDNFTLQMPMPYPLGIGDTFIATAGCDKAKTTCIGKFDNVVNFRGFSFIPGQDKILLVGGQ